MIVQNGAYWINDFGTELFVVIAPELCAVAVAALSLLAGMFGAPRRWVTAVGLLGLGTGLLYTLPPWLFRESIVPFSHSFTGAGRLSAFHGAVAVDELGAFFKALIIIAAGLTLLASHRYAERFAVRSAEFNALLLISTAGLMLLASAEEFITIYVALELSTLPLVALAAFSRGGRASEAGLKYLVLSAVASATLLYGMALTFGFTGTTELRHVAPAVRSAVEYGTGPFAVEALVLGLVLMVAGFGFKLAAVPFHGWAPDVYEGAPTPVTAFLSVASKAAGFAVVMRVLVEGFAWVEADWGLLMAGLAVASMTFGNLAAIAQSNIKRMLAYSTIAHAGYILVGLAAIGAGEFHDGLRQTLSGTDYFWRFPSVWSLAAGGVLFYLAGYAVTNLAAFFSVIALAERTGRESIASFAGMGRRAPWLAAALTIALLSLTGIPLTVGFIAKLAIFGAAVDAGLAWLVALGAVNSVVSAYYYLRVVRVMYLSEPAAEDRPGRSLPLELSVGMAAAAVVALGLWPQPLFGVAERVVGDFALRTAWSTWFSINF